MNVITSGQKRILLFLLQSTLFLTPIYSEDKPMINFIQCNDPKLSQRSQEVPLEDIKSPEIQDIIDELFKIAKGERNDIDTPIMVGLAAPQVGITKRIILVDTGVDHDRTKLGELKVYINPVIAWASDELEKGREGCYSVDGRVRGVVMRPSHILIQAYDRQGIYFTEELHHFTARIFQHECDHLDGLEFPDRMSPNDSLHWVESSDFHRYREHWESWDLVCPWEVWKAMKSGEPFDPPTKQNQ
jgi:peptide deformylase